VRVDCQDHILLTGAGFTKNFGGPLAKELWSIIFNNPILDKAPDVRDLLRRNFDFESAYDSVMRGPKLLDTVGRHAWENQRQALRIAVNEAYEYIDQKVRSFAFREGAPYPVNVYMVQDFISRFAGTPKMPGYFFTLNQDLFIERHYYNGRRPVLPGVPHRSSWFTGDGGQSLRYERCVMPDSASNVVFSGSPFYYLKLHGSSNWYGADQETMIIGRSKETQIASQPILAAYFDAFRSVLTSANRRLLCVGYSFSDEHINAVISDGVESGLQVYVLSPEPPDELATRLVRQHKIGETILDGLVGHFPWDLKTLFPADQSVSAEWGVLQSRFFGSRGTANGV